MKTINEKRLYSLLYSRFVCKDDCHYKRKFVMHKGGYLYASDGYILVKMQFPYNDELEGKAVNKGGDIIYESEDYEKVITRSESYGVVLDDETVSKLRVGAKNLCGKNSDFYISIGRYAFSYSNEKRLVVYKSRYLKAAFDLFNLVKESFRIYTTNSKSVYMQDLIFKSVSSDTVVEIFPRAFDEEELRVSESVYTIDEAVNFEKVKA
jgi:hypothetical protein